MKSRSDKSINIVNNNSKVIEVANGSIAPLVPQKSLLAARFINNSQIKKHDQISTQFFGFNTSAISKQNLHRMRQLLGKSSIAEHVINQHGNSFPLLNYPQSLTEQEQIIFKTLIDSFTLKHATDAIDSILASGKIQSVRDLEVAGNQTKRHTSYKSGLDRSVYFVFGIGNHNTPPFLDYVSHVMTADLKRMAEIDLLTLKRLWVSGHLTEYEKERIHNIRLGNVNFTLQHNKDTTKTYLITYDTGEIVQWAVQYQDEIFSGYDVAPGIAFQFIYMLRLVGGHNNPLVDKLYKTSRDSDLYIPLLQKIFTTIMPGWVYPEAKIIGELDIRKDYIHFTENTPCQSSVNSFSFLKQAIKTKNDKCLLALLKKGYTSTNKTNELFSTVIEKVADLSIRHRMMKHLTKYGHNPFKPQTRDSNTALHVVAENGTAKDLDYLLSLQCPDQEEPLIGFIANPNMAYNRDNSLFLDLVDIVCARDQTGEMLKVLKKHGADFKTHGYNYLSTAINPGKGHLLLEEKYTTNIRAVEFLQKEGVTANLDNAWNLTPLMQACEMGRLDIVRFLIEKMDAQVNAKNKTFLFGQLTGEVTYDHPDNGMTALHFAVKCGDRNIVAYLLSKGADPQALTQDKRRPIDLDQSHQLKKLFSSYTKKSSTQEKELISKQATKPINMQNHKVAVMLTGTKNDGRTFVILGRRRSDDEATSNYFCFPGGSADEHDLSLEEAAMRELYEETGINAKEIAGAIINKLGTFDGFEADDHATTTIFKIDVGNYPVTPFPSDDLIDARRVFIENIARDPSQQPATYMQYDDHPILGSNALLIENCLMQKHGLLSTRDFKKIRQQLHLEAQGYDRVLSLINQNKTLIPGSNTWNEIELLLKNHAHFAPKGLNKQSLSGQVMLTMSPLEGLSLLARYGVDFNSTMEKSNFTIDKDKFWQRSPLFVAVALNRIDILKHLLSLGATFSDFNQNQSMLQVAAKKGYSEMLAFLISYGLDPNKSFSELARPGSGIEIVYPLIGLAIENDQLQLMDTLLQEGSILVNRERSAGNRNTTLIQAIKSNKKEACFRLLATCRFNVNPKSLTHKYTYKEQSESAAELANKNGWIDVATIIDFLSNYADMNEYLAKHNLPEMERFFYSFDEKDGKSTIHFMISDLGKIKQISQAVHGGCTIHRTEDFYYIRLGIHRLATLVGDKKIAEFLLNYTEKSVIWSVRSDSYRQLQRQLIENNITTLSIDLLNLNDQFNGLIYPDYYRQLIKENLSLQNAVIDLNCSDKSALHWLIDAVNGHDKIQCVLISSNNSLNSENTESLNKITGVLPSLKDLQKIVFCNLPLTHLLTLLSHLQQTLENKNTKIVIRGFYNREEYKKLLTMLKENACQFELSCPNAPKTIQGQMDRLIAHNQINYYFYRDALSLTKVHPNNDNLTLSLNKPFNEQGKNRAFYKMALLYAKPSHLQVDHGFDETEFEKIGCFIENNSSIESISFSKTILFSQILTLLNAISASQIKLKYLDLSDCNLSTDNINALTNILKTQPIVHLNILGVKFKTEDVTAIKYLRKAIASNQYLEVIDISNSKFPDNKTANRFLRGLCNSKTLLCVVNNSYSWRDVFKKSVFAELSRVTSKNCEDQLTSKASPINTMQSKTENLFDLLPDETLSCLNLNQNQTTQSAMASTCWRFYNLFQPKRLADKLLWTVTSGDQKKAKQILREFINEGKWLKNIDCHKALKSIAQHPLSSLELRLLALTALAKIIGEECIKTRDEQLFCQFKSTVQRLILMSQKDEYFEALLWVLIDILTKKLNVNECFADKPPFDIEETLDALNSDSQDCRNLREYSFPHAEKILLYLHAEQREKIFQSALLALKDKEYLINSSARKICISMWPYLDTQQRQEILKKSPGLFEEAEKKKSPKDPTQILLVLTGGGDLIRKDLALRDCNFVWEEFNEEQRMIAIERVIHILDNNNQGGMAFQAIPAIWSDLNVEQQSHVLRKILSGMEGFSSMRENAYFVSAMLWPQLSEQQHNKVWKAAHYYLRCFFDSLEKEMSKKYLIEEPVASNFSLR